MDTAMVIRIIVLVIALINQVLTFIGKNPIPFSDDVIYEMVTIIVTVSASAWASWKNNNMTKAAQTAQKVLDALKAGQITYKEIEDILNK